MLLHLFLLTVAHALIKSAYALHLSHSIQNWKQSGHNLRYCRAAAIQRVDETQLWCPGKLLTHDTLT